MTIRDIPDYEEINPHLKALVDIAFNSNIMCYDPNAKSGEFSDRLIIITINALTLVFGEKLDAIIHDDSGIISTYFEKLNGLMPSGKQRIALFVSNSNAIMAAY